MLSLKGRYEARGLRVIAVARYDGEPDERDLIGEAMLEEHMTYPSFVDKDSRWQRAAGIYGTYPFFYVVDKTGTIVLRQSGKLEVGNANYEHLRTAIERALGGA